MSGKQSLMALGTGLLLTVWVTSAAWLNPSPASATTVDLSCTGTAATTYEPGITFTPHTITATSTGTFAPCYSTDPTLHSGTYTSTASGTVSCTGGSFSGTNLYTWDNGHTTTIKFTQSISVRPGGEVIAVSTGTVSHGQFLGDTFTRTDTLFHLDPLTCLGSGVTGSGGPVTTTFHQP